MGLYGIDLGEIWCIDSAVIHPSTRKYRFLTRGMGVEIDIERIYEW